MKKSRPPYWQVATTIFYVLLIGFCCRWIQRGSLAGVFSNKVEKPDETAQSAYSDYKEDGYFVQTYNLPAIEKPRFKDTVPKKDLFNAYLILKEWEEPLNQKGHTRRTVLVRTFHIYPLIMISQEYADGKPAGKLMEWVGDHVLVKLNEGFQRQDLLKIIQPFGYQIRAWSRLTDTYLVIFNPGVKNAVFTAIKNLKDLREVKSVEREFIRSD